MLQAVPENVNIKNLTTELNKIEGIVNIHDFHIWSLDGNYNVASLHAVVENSDKNWENDIHTAIVQLMEKHHIQHPTIQFETTMKNCRLVGC